MSRHTKPPDCAGVETRAFTTGTAEENESHGLVEVPLAPNEIFLQQYFLSWALYCADEMEDPRFAKKSRFQEHVDVQGLVTDRPWLLPTVSSIFILGTLIAKPLNRTSGLTVFA